MPSVSCHCHHQGDSGQAVHASRLASNSEVPGEVQTDRHIWARLREKPGGPEPSYPRANTAPTMSKQGPTLLQ